MALAVDPYAELDDDELLALGRRRNPNDQDQEYPQEQKNQQSTPEAQPSAIGKPMATPEATATQPTAQPTTQPNTPTLTDALTSQPTSIGRQMAPRPAEQHYEDLANQGAPQYHGWKRALDVLGRSTKIGNAIEAGAGIGTTGYYTKLNNAEGEAENENTAIKNRDTEQENAARIDQQEALADQEKARAEALRSPPPKPKTFKPIQDTQGHILGFTDDKGALIGPNSPELTQDMKDMMAAAVPRPAKEPKHQPGEVRLNEGIPDGVYGDNDKLYRAGDPNMPQDLKEALADATAAHTQKVNEQTKLATAGRAVYAGSRAINVQTPDGQVHGVDGLDLPNFMRDNPGSVVLTGVTAAAGGKEALINDIRGAANRVATNISVLDRKGFDYAQLATALANPTTTAGQYLQSIPRGSLDQQGQQFVSDLFSLRENAMAMRSVLGAGQGAEDLRAAILNTLPGISSGSAGFGKIQLQNLMATLDRVERGVPGVPQRPDTSQPQPPHPADQGMKWQHRTVNGQVQWRQVQKPQ